MSDLKRFASMAGGMCTAALLSALVVGACGGSDDPETVAATGGTGNEGGSGPVAGTGPVATGGTTTGTGGAGGTVPVTPAACEGQPVQSSSTLVDFSTWNNGSWGASVNNAKGGRSLYQGSSASALTDAVDLSAADPVLHLTANLVAGEYTGIVLWFQSCTNASSFSGISVTIGGSWGGASMLLQVQTNNTYPAGTAQATKGACTVNGGKGDYTNCYPPTYAVQTTDAGQALQLPWSSFVNGKGGTDAAGTIKQMAVEPGELMGIQIQFEKCEATAGCPIDVTISDIGLI